MKNLVTLFLAACLSFPVFSQTLYYYPPGYFGLLNNQLTSARSQAMGFTTLTKGGIENSFYNPAAIGNTGVPVQVYANYANGHSYRPDSHYYFVGGAYKINPKLAIGLSYFTYRNPDPVWTTIIGGVTYDTDFFAQSVLSAVVSYQIFEELEMGLGINLMEENAINGEQTNSDFMPSVGFQYEKELPLIKSESFENQRIKGALSLTNFLFKNTTLQTYENSVSVEYLPIILRIGAGYQFDTSLKSGWIVDKGYFQNSPQQVRFSLDVQYQDYLKGSDAPTTDHESNTAFGVGAEAWFFERLAVRLGYFNEKGPSGTKDTGELWVTGNRAGFTWGYGTLIPTNQLTGGKMPFDIQVDFITAKQLSSLNEEIYTHPNVFTENTFQFSFGLNLLWRK
ncbi:MAG: hypothetical protein P8O16_17705 [Algoriphagus sp.]|uniref:hypothetical protein n=1 Tax=Algoriphagus sp. TaxID=1872435 RepID=UPI00261E6774|nr:hypothetical protein [Algoriphagus sp.]MDG1279120.1 hypothetical protein [Algoriphagus sp.]